jgi:16S rRNA (cytosine967-C5)-methyltransferase
LEDVVRLPGGWHPAVETLLDAGLVVVQDEAAGLVAHLARPVPRARVLDLCAAPGGKTFHFAQLCGDAFVLACDASATRLASLSRMRTKLGFDAVHPVVADGLTSVTAGGFSRVLVDAPCTNTGVLGKRPDARWRRGPEDVVRLADLQSRLLDEARGQVAPGGILVYSTCSLEPEENEGVIRAYRTRHPQDRILPASEVLPEEVVQGDFLATVPGRHGMDGTFAAAIRPNGGAFEVIS